MTFTVTIHMTHGLSDICLTGNEDVAEKFKETEIGTDGFLRFHVDDGPSYNIATRYIGWIEIKPNG